MVAKSKKRTAAPVASADGFDSADGFEDDFDEDELEDFLSDFEDEDDDDFDE